MGISPYLAGLRARVGHDLILSPGVTGVVIRSLGGTDKEVLLVRRKDNSAWTLISGAIDPGEETYEAIQREVLEETGITAHATHLLWVQTLPQTTYPNGDIIQYIDFAFICEVDEGIAHVNDDESVDVQWFSVNKLPDLDERYAKTVQLALSYGSQPYFGPQAEGLGK